MHRDSGGDFAMENVIAVVLGGGRGTRLFPLTRYRSKPAVPIGASYRLIDIAVSNCIHANLKKIFVLTQYQSESLNRHVASTYKFDEFSSGFVDILAAEQTDEAGSDWFRGTADAVRKCLKHIGRESWDTVAILSGDQLYRMSLSQMLRVHAETNAAATVATKPVPAELTPGFGIMKTDAAGRITHFEEKPPTERLRELASRLPSAAEPAYLASMGIYVFSRSELERVLADGEPIDFGRHVLPAMLPRGGVQSFLYEGYWEDVGTIRSYYEANLDLMNPEPVFDFYHPRYPIYTHRPFLAPSKIRSCQIERALVADGCALVDACISRSVIGTRSRIGAGTRITNSLVLGADDYETSNERDSRTPPLGIGEGTSIEGAIIDKNARIGKNVKITSAAGRPDYDGDRFFIRDGIVLVPKGGVVPDGTVI
jgi:glucose-1-phosphate adenylyltransferase